MSSMRTALLHLTHDDDRIWSRRKVWMFNEDFESVNISGECLLLSYQSFINIYFTWNIITTIILYKAYYMEVTLEPKWSWVISKSQKYRHSHDFWPVLLPTPLTYQSLDLWNFICCQKNKWKNIYYFKQCYYIFFFKYNIYLYILFCFMVVLLIIFPFLGSSLPTTLDGWCWIKSSSDAHGYCCSNGRKHLHEIVPEQFTQLGK